ncbi:nitrogen fixation/metabolism regulation signal transduction histidine kinase [Sinorhizobium kostiense]|uniref:Nitrogen fixation/metabolism regulation signal transduction histidine kinase n=1 Tax=Sinorhizobium kostiense TaxID=76747 RepID=A0ABS4R530_9HYPH|nr:hypothetical protein [Sinorhizobium kostiense]MBP2237980.1 nitrogen fixation/metabolism regulation signal transduction histidine kinase [Sinorhizobium kostiense]
MAESLHPAAVAHLPAFITAPGESDVLMNVMIIFVLLIVLLVGVLYLRLHALPEHLAHGASKVQLQLVAVLSLIALFTHNHLFWIGALLLALIEFPDFTTPVSSMAESLRRIADRDEWRETPIETAPTEVHVAPTKPHPVHAGPQLAPVEPEPTGNGLSERRG